MSAALVQSKASAPGSVSTAQNLTFDSPTTSGHLIEVTVVLRQDATGGRTIAVTDSQGNTYSTAVTSGPSTAFSRQTIKFYVANCVGGASHQITVTPSGTVTLAFLIDEWSGLETTSPLDKTATGSNTGTSVTTGSTGTLAQADELVTCGVGTPGVAHTLTPGSGWTADPATATGVSNEYKVVSATTAVSGVATLGASITWNAALATYKIAVGGGGLIIPLVQYHRQMQGIA